MKVEIENLDSVGWIVVVECASAVEIMVLIYPSA